MALLAQKAENQWVGVNCGIMDQLISAAGEAGHALLIDCRSLDKKSVPLPRGSAVVVLDTATRRGLVSSAYNERREQVRRCRRVLRRARAARRLDASSSRKSAGAMRVTMRRRARHIVTRERAHAGRGGRPCARSDAAAFGPADERRATRACATTLRCRATALDVMVEVGAGTRGLLSARA